MSTYKVLKKINLAFLKANENDIIQIHNKTYIKILTKLKKIESIENLNKENEKETEEVKIKNTNKKSKSKKI